MTPFYYGEPGRRLFGIYEPPVTAKGTPRAAVLCHPFAQEQIRAYRAMRRLAVRLTRAGWHVLRFADVEKVLLSPSARIRSGRHR